METITISLKEGGQKKIKAHVFHSNNVSELKFYTHKHIQEEGIFKGYYVITEASTGCIAHWGKTSKKQLEKEFESLFSDMDNKMNLLRAVAIMSQKNKITYQPKLF